MEDLDELLSDLENVSNYSNNVNYRTKSATTTANYLADSNSSPSSSSTSSSVSFNSVVSNNKITSNDFIQTINKIASSHLSFKNEPNKKTQTERKFTDDFKLNQSTESIDKKSDCSTDSTYDDLNELDKLLDDLDTARKKLASGDSLSNKISKMSDDLSDELSTSSSLMPSPSLSSPVLNNKSQNNSLVLDQKMISEREDYNNKSKTINAANELEKLMASLTMYKNQNEDEQFENETIVRKNSLRDEECKIKNLCRSCEMPINGQVITALGYLWHPDHFVCSHCNCSIGTSIFYEKDNQPYCELDYIQLFSPKCAACNTPILDKMLTALNKSWHINCFSCDSCSKPLNDESFLEINNTAYCKDCYVSELAPKCKRCNEAIIENFISALNSYFHPSCFVCTDCGMPFNASSFYEYNNMPYCELHYHLKRGSLCANCQKPINGRCVTAMNKKYHPEHFVCSFCLNYLNKGTFKEQNDKPYCHQCFQHLF